MQGTPPECAMKISWWWGGGGVAPCLIPLLLLLMVNRTFGPQTQPSVHLVIDYIIPTININVFVCTLYSTQVRASPNCRRPTLKILANFPAILDFREYPQKEISMNIQYESAPFVVF